MARVVGRLPVGLDTGGPKLSQPSEVAVFSKTSEGRVHADRRGLAEYVEPRLPIDLNVGYDTFRDRDRTNAYPAPLDPFVSTVLQLEHGVEELQAADVVTWRGNIAKLLMTPFNTSEGWVIEVERIGRTLFLNVRETDETLARESSKSERNQRMTYWGFSFEDKVTQPPHREEAAKDCVDASTGFYSIVRAKIGGQRLLMSGEVDCCFSGRGRGQAAYVELKTTRVMDTAPQVMRFERDKLLKWWAQSYVVGVSTIMVGFRDDHGSVSKLQMMETASLPRYVAGKPHMWHPSVCSTFLDRVLTWLQATIPPTQPSEGSAAPLSTHPCPASPPSTAARTRFRLVYSPPGGKGKGKGKGKGDSRSVHPGAKPEVVLFEDPDIPAFVPDEYLDELARRSRGASGGAEHSSGSRDMPRDGAAPGNNDEKSSLRDHDQAGSGCSPRPRSMEDAESDGVQATQVCESRGSEGGEGRDAAAPPASTQLLCANGSGSIVGHKRSRSEDND